MEADMNKAAAFTRLPANGWQRDCPFKLGDVIFSTEMKVLPLRLPTASYGGAIWAIFYSLCSRCRAYHRSAIWLPSSWN